MHATTTAPAPAVGYQPASRSDALAHAEQIGCDGIYGDTDNLADALRDTAARWHAEGAMARLEAVGLTNHAA